MEGFENRDYQQIGTNFLRAMERAFLTDDPGLGKTIQAIRAVELPCTVVAPRYLTGQWEDAILREHGDAKIARADGTRAQREAILDQKADWYIINLEMLATYALPNGMRTHINDEAHRLRNRRAQQSVAAYEYENRDPKSRIYHLTATPMWKAPDDIWMQARILYPKVDVFKSYKRFRDLFCVTLNSPHGPKVVSIKKSMRGPLRDLLRPIMLGRTYKDVGRFLPDVIESNVHITLTKELKELYKKLEDEYSLLYGENKEKLIFESAGVFHALRQVTAFSGKFEAIQGILEDNPNKPAVIGFWYKDHAAEMQKILGANSVLITGDLDPVERHRQATMAQRQGKHIVASQESLKEGIDLSKYRLFVFGEEHYVPESNRQFMTRVVRDRNDNGKDTEPVRVFYVQVKDTIDTAIHATAKRRGNVISSVREVLDRTLQHAR